MTKCVRMTGSAEEPRQAGPRVRLALNYLCDDELSVPCVQFGDKLDVRLALHAGKAETCDIAAWCKNVVACGVISIGGAFHCDNAGSVEHLARITGKLLEISAVLRKESVPPWEYNILLSAPRASGPQHMQAIRSVLHEGNFLPMRSRWCAAIGFAPVVTDDEQCLGSIDGCTACHATTSPANLNKVLASNARTVYVQNREEKLAGLGDALDNEKLIAVFGFQL